MRRWIWRTAAFSGGFLALGAASSPEPTAIPARHARPAAAPVAEATEAPASELAPVPSPEVIARIEALVRELGDENWIRRQRAMDELIAIGEDARPRLAALLRETTDEEIRTRVEAALQQMNEARLMGTSLVTLHAEDQPAAAVFAELARQAYARFRFAPADLWEKRPMPRVTVHVDRQPFWAVMKDLCAQAGVEPIGGNPSARELILGVPAAPAGAAALIGATSSATAAAALSAGRRHWGTAPTAISGPFLVAATHVTRTHYLDLQPAGAVRRDCRITMSVFPEPKLRVLQGSMSVRITEAADEKGNSLAPPTPFSDYLATRTDWVWSVYASLQPQPDGGNRIARLKGSARFVLQTGSERAEFGDVLEARNAVRTAGGRRMALNEVRPEGTGRYRVSLTLYRTGLSGPAEFGWIGSYNNLDVRLVDAEGHALVKEQTTPQSSTTEAVVLNITFRRPTVEAPPGAKVEGPPVGEPAKLVWEVPTEMREVIVPFEFADLPLP